MTSCLLFLVAVYGRVDPRRPLADQPAAELLPVGPCRGSDDGPSWLETYRKAVETWLRSVTPAVRCDASYPVSSGSTASTSSRSSGPSAVSTTIP